MIGRRELFSDLDTSIRGSMRFGDVSMVEIQGIGSIVFKARPTSTTSTAWHVLHPGATQFHHEPWLAR
jgi:hypothetical protein